MIPFPCLALLGLTAALPAQNQTVQTPPFHAEVRLVVLQATVRNSRGEVVTGLDQHAFTVYEDGRPQPIALFRRDDVPVSLGLLIDNSGSMRPLRAKVEAAALTFARASNPLDEVFVMNFADKVSLDVPLTGDRRALEAGIARVDSIGGTAMRDAVDRAETYLTEHATKDRKVLLVITDGNDNASLAPLERIEQRAEQAGTVIYAIGLFGSADPGRLKLGHRELDRLAERTGGLSYYPANLDEIPSVVTDIAHQIRLQYTIAYAPVNQAEDGSYRTIRLEARGPGRLSVRTRPGYRALKKPGH
jgi:VWFA-related protein